MLGLQEPRGSIRVVLVVHMVTEISTNDAGLEKKLHLEGYFSYVWADSEDEAWAVSPPRLCKGAR